MPSLAKRVNLVGAAAVVAIALCLTALLALPEPVHACSCIQLSRADYFFRADSVFAGEVISVKDGPDKPLTLSEGDPISVEFMVHQVWKGPGEERLTVKTSRHGPACGYGFEEGVEYLVYARDGETSLCSGTTTAAEGSTYYEELGHPWMPNVPTGPDIGLGPKADGSGSRCNVTFTSRQPTDLSVLAVLVGAIALGSWRRPRI